METYAVCYENASVGTMTAEREGDCLRVALRCRGCGQGIYRAFLLCRRGEIPLGVLEPMGEEVGLCRRVRLREIEGRGGVTGAAVRLSWSFREGWQRAEEGFFCRGGFGEISWEGAMWRPEGKGRLLALPYEQSRPFPLAGLFCFARIMPVQGCCCAVYCFNEQEQPVMVEKTL